MQLWREGLLARAGRESLEEGGLVGWRECADHQVALGAEPLEEGRLGQADASSDLVRGGRRPKLQEHVARDVKDGFGRDLAGTSDLGAPLSSK